jgi:hypothetical protein
MATETEERGLVVRDDSDYSLSMVTTPTEQMQRLGELRQFLDQYMVKGEDYGLIPGTGNKPTLLKPGAEKLCDVYGLSREVEVTHRIEDWERPFFHYEVKATLRSMRTGLVVAEGIGSCNSHETKYRYRQAARKCPVCGTEAIIKGKAEYGGGWLCFGKKGGCGAKFEDGDETITGQEVGRVENPDVADVVNTILKMAKKRGLVDAVLSATRSSGLLTQDIEDMGESPDNGDIGTTARKPLVPEPKPARRAAPPTADPPKQAAAYVKVAGKFGD